MGIKKKLPKGLEKAIEEFDFDDEITLGEIRQIRDDLTEFIDEQNNARGEMSERWQEGDTASAHAEFISQCEALRDAFESVITEIEGIDLSLPSMES
jgi:hypothetical protein